MLDLGASTNDVFTDKSSVPLDCADFQDQKLRVSMGKWGSEKHVLMEVDHSADHSAADAQMTAWLTMTAISMHPSCDVSSIGASHVPAERRTVAKLTLIVEDPPACLVEMGFGV